MVWETNCSGVRFILSFSFHKPLALLKSGIPLSQLQPAPPKADLVIHEAIGKVLGEAVNNI